MTATEFDLVVTGGTVATVDGAFPADIAVADGRIAAIGSGPFHGRQVVEAGGKLVIPGGIDVHTHFDTEIGGARTADDFESGTRAAAAGGLTTTINFALQDSGETLHAAVAREQAKLERAAHIDLGLHVGVTDVTAGSLAEIETLAAEGFTSYKMFTAVGEHQLSDPSTLALMQAVAHANSVLMVHAEDGALIDHLTGVLLAEGHTGAEFLNAARPVAAEALAVARVTEYGRQTGCPIYIVHLSSRAALDAVRAARSAGAEVYVETRPAYLFMDSSVYSRDDGAKFVTWPPIRGLEDQQYLWAGLRVGEIQTYATDHTTWTVAQKMAPGLTFATMPGGVSNVQTSLGMLYDRGVRAGRISLSQFVAVTSTNPAKLFGLWPRKGSLSVGADADIVVLDPEKQFTIVSNEMESSSDFDPYDTQVVHGWPVTTISRGEIVMTDGQIVSRPGRGRLVKRDHFASR